MIDILYVAYNRLEYTQASFAALIANTNWDEVRCLYVKDDGSTDGTREHLQQTMEFMDHLVTRVFDDRPGGGPVAAMNAYLDWHATRPSEGEGEDESKVEIFAKIDNDFVVCPGWLNEMLRQTTLHPEVDVLGTEPRFGPAVPVPHSERFSRLARHIGGKGLIRHRIFSSCRPKPHGPHGYQGWSQYQTAHHNLTYAWITPDLPTFGLDQLPFGGWPELRDEYVELGWHRAWDLYSNDANMKTYWDWWT